MKAPLISVLLSSFYLLAHSALLGDAGSLTFAGASAKLDYTDTDEGNLRQYVLSSDATLRDNLPPDRRFAFAESERHARVRTGNAMFDALYAMAVHEVLQNSVESIRDNAYAHGESIEVSAFQTGAKWTYVWTRDLAYALHQSLAGFDPERAVESLLFKASPLKPEVRGGAPYQIVQDTGSGGSYPVSTDRVVWAMGAHETLKYLEGAERASFLRTIYPYMRDTIEQDRQLVFDARDGLYRGEHSFLDWREQTYPRWTADDVLAVGMSKALSVNAANYFLLQTAAEYAGMLGDLDRQTRYSEWAEALRAAIHRQFFDEEAGLFRTYLLSDDGSYDLALDRYDLLGNSLAILLGVADSSQARRIIENYPTGPYGPPVIWPEVPSVPIYHNQGIWPFVTAYWTKAAKAVGHSAAVNAGIESLMGLAAVNLSNMENFDFVTGKAEVTEGERVGPTINSRRQLWSVSGYLSMVQDIVFGLESDLSGIRFQPFVTAELRNTTFAEADRIEWLNFNYKGSRHDVAVNLPPVGALDRGAYAIERIQINGQEIGGGFVAAESFRSENLWVIDLSAEPKGSQGSNLTEVDVDDPMAIFGPVQPQWDESRGGIVVKDRRLVLHIQHPQADRVRFNIYRNGKLHAEAVKGGEWIDPDSADHERIIYSYSVEAYYPESGLVSHPTPMRSYRAEDQVQRIPATAMINRGGNLVGKHHFENWGEPGDELVTESFRAVRPGVHFIRAEFSNGSGAVNTGITCAVKRLDLIDADSGEVVASDYLIMPQSANWNRWDLSNTIPAELEAGKRYTIRIYEDPYSRNMSYLQSNERYTAFPGGGKDSYNYVNIASVQLLYLKPPHP